MKIRSYAFIGASLFLMLATACNSDKVSDDRKSESKSLEFETYSFSRVAEQSGGESVDLPGARYLHVVGQGVLPVKLGDNDIAQLRDSLLSMARVEFPSSGDAAPMIDKDWKLTNLADSVQACNEQYNYLSIVLNTPAIIVWQAYVGEYNCGAAHGMYANMYLNYSLRSGRILSLKDLMKPGYEKALVSILVEKLSSIDSIQATPSEIGIPSQWYVTPTGVTFVYGVYEIAPYSSGEIEVPVYLYEIEELLTPEGLSLLSPTA